MNARIGSIGLRFETTPSRRAEADRVVHELRSSLPEELRTALAAHASRPGVAVVPKLNVTMRAPISRIRGRELAERIAAACVQCIVEESVTLELSEAVAESGAAEMFLRTLATAPGVRADPAIEAAAWLVAIARDEWRAFRTISVFADLEHLATPAALVAICEHCNPRDVLAALGRKWATTIVRRCTAEEARRLLQLLDDGREPEVSTWVYVRAALSGAAGSGPEETFDGADVRALVVAVEGFFAERPGIFGAAQTLARSIAGVTTRLALPPGERRDGEMDAITSAGAPVITGRDERERLTLDSECTGFWLLLPHLARRLREYNDDDARAIATRVAKALFGARASDDPAISVFSPREPLASGGERIAGVCAERLAVAVVRDFARTLHRFERARGGYIARAMLFGSGRLWQVEDRWCATLPHSPLRIVLERTSPYGDVSTPWAEPKLELVRDP